MADIALVAPHIVDAEGNNAALAQILIVVVEDLQLSLHIALAFPVEIAYTFLLLAVHADYRHLLAGDGYPSEDDFKLLIPLLIATCS